MAEGKVAEIRTIVGAIEAAGRVEGDGPPRKIKWQKTIGGAAARKIEWQRRFLRSGGAAPIQSGLVIQLRTAFCELSSLFRNPNEEAGRY